MQERTEWLDDLATHIECHWPLHINEAVYKDTETGLTILTDQAKVHDLPALHARQRLHPDTIQEHMATLSNWSAGPTFRAYVPNADLYVTVRPHYD